MKPFVRKQGTEGFSEALARRWGDFVACEQRLLTELPFFREIVGTFAGQRVLDTCTGMGCEAISLAKFGAHVVANEIDPGLLQSARERAARAGVECSWTSCDWRELEKCLGGEPFNLVLCLGNSVSMLSGASDRVRVMREFRKVCSKAGALVIDERNYRYILQDRERILQGQFRYGRKVIYCGTKVSGRPIAIGEDCVVFGYFDGATGGRLGTLEAYPFKEGQLLQEVRDAGFSDVTVYSDLSEGVSGDDDFYTYVCR